MESEKEKMGTGRLYDANYDTELDCFTRRKSIFCWNNPFIAIMAIILR